MGQGDDGVGIEDNLVRAAGWGGDFADVREVDEVGAVDAEEAVGGEALFEGREGFAMKVAAAAVVEGDVVAVGLDVVDAEDAEEMKLVAIAHGQALVGEMGDAFHELIDAGWRGFPGFSRGNCAVEGGVEPLFFPGLQEVIDGADRKGFEGMLVVSGGKNDGRAWVVFGQMGEHFEAGELRHLNVDKQDVEFLREHGLEGERAITAFGGDLAIAAGARRRFVVGDEDADHGFSRGVMGMVMVTRVPPAAEAGAIWRENFVAKRVSRRRRMLARPMPVPLLPLRWGVGAGGRGRRRRPRW